MQIRRAGQDDLDGLTSLLADAFRSDPLWRWVFPDAAGLARLWRFYLASALRYPWVWIAGDFAAASVWIPPGGTELTAGEEEQVEPIFRELLGDRARDVMTLMERFEAAHPSEPHYYLSLLGTADAHRGRGIGMALLADNLRRIDQDRMPAYLESSNPVNIHRYEAAGFARRSEFNTPDDARTVTTMWRDPGSRRVPLPSSDTRAARSPARSGP
jgi:GNAT superfamily N-acetyltransferase